MFNYILYRIGQFIALALPVKLCYKIAIVCSDLHYIFADQDRRQVRENLKAIFPEKSEREIRGLRINMARNFAKYLADFFRFEKINLEYIKKNIRVENIHYFDQACARNKGVIVLTAHLGNWELGGVVISLLGYPFWVVALPHKDKRVDRFFNYQRERKGIKVIPLNKAVRMGMNILKRKQMLALVGDRVFTDGGVVLDFFGKLMLFPQGPAAFALKTGAVIVPGFMLRNKDESFTLRIEEPIELAPGVDKESDIKSIIGRYKIIFEKY
ncbi:MAG: hypothetical protein A3K83_03790, partial [Omnitrophica WOR_2 bacterium RBG_13_44_8b]